MIDYSKWPLGEAKLKLHRAYRHIQELEEGVKFITQQQLYEFVIEKQPNGPQLLKFVPKVPMPDALPCAIGDVVHNLRCVLDYSAAAVIANAKGSPEDLDRVGFPFHEFRDNLIDMLDKGPFKIAGPAIRSFILDEVKPYKAGNYDLWALNKMDNLDKHRLLLATFGVTKVTGVCLLANGGKLKCNDWSFQANPGFPIDAALFDDVEVTNKGEATFDIFFLKGQYFEEAPVISTLKTLAEKVRQVGEKLEAFVLSGKPSGAGT